MNMPQKKPSGLWWKCLVWGIGLIVFAVVVGFATARRSKPQGELFVHFQTGREVTFELKESGKLWVEEKKWALGAGPGRIRDAAKTVRLYGPGGEQISLSDEKFGDWGDSIGTFDAPGPGNYRLVADSNGTAETGGKIRGKQPYSFAQTVCDICFYFALPLGLVLVVLGGILGIVRGASHAVDGGLEDGSI